MQSSEKALQHQNLTFYIYIYVSGITPMIPPIRPLTTACGLEINKIMGKGVIRKFICTILDLFTNTTNELLPILHTTHSLLFDFCLFVPILINRD
jgi:hypothetical protein